MRIDGRPFRDARKKIRAKHPGNGSRNGPAIGTQEWLSDETGICLRAIQRLEQSNQASKNTVQTLSKKLGIAHWKQYELDYGLAFVHSTTSGVVDFRPEYAPSGSPEDFMDSPLMLTIDPLSILADSGDFELFHLQEINLLLTGLEQPIRFNWFAEVSLTPGANGWLGWVKEVDEMPIMANDQTLRKTIMFSQESVPHVSWSAFVSQVEASQSSQFDIEVKLCFLRFEKKFKVRISVDLLKILFEKGREKYGSEWPYRAHIKAIT